MKAKVSIIVVLVILASFVLTACGVSSAPATKLAHPAAATDKTSEVKVNLNNPKVQGNVPVGWYFIPVALLAGAIPQASWISVIEGGATVAYFAPAIPVGITVVTAIAMIFSGSAVIQQDAEGPLWFKTVDGDQIAIDRVTGQVRQVVKAQVQTQIKESNMNPTPQPSAHACWAWEQVQEWWGAIDSISFQSNTSFLMVKGQAVPLTTIIGKLMAAGFERKSSNIGADGVEVSLWGKKPGWQDPCQQ